MSDKLKWEEIKPTAKLYWNEDLLKHLEWCGRLCYDSRDKITEDSAEKFIDGLIKNGHLSVLEHAGAVFASTKEKDWDKIRDTSPEFGLLSARAALGSVRCSDLVAYCSKYNNAASLREIKRSTDLLTFELTASRSCTHQLVRHRNLSYSQQSLRYCKLSDKAQYVKPYIPKQAEEAFMKALDQSGESYLEMLEQGCNPDEARSVLPMCTATKIMVTGQLSWWLDFLRLRYHKRASREIRQIAMQIFDQSPEVLKDTAERLGMLEGFKEAANAER